VILSRNEGMNDNSPKTPKMLKRDSENSSNRSGVDEEEQQARILEQ
jgi:hypothetical protein